MTSTSRTPSMERHPDIMEMRMRYEEAAESPAGQLTEGLTLLAAVYLAISPWVVGFSNLPTIATTNLVIGITAAVLALGFAFAFGRTHGLAWVLPVIGIWTIISPWLVSGEVNTVGVVTSNVITGAVLLVLGLLGIGLGMRRAGRAGRSARGH